jgi:hypothetical protein
MIRCTGCNRKLNEQEQESNGDLCTACVNDLPVGRAGGQKYPESTQARATARPVDPIRKDQK